MKDPRAARLADLLVNYSVAVQPGDKVAIVGGPEALPAVKETMRAVLRAGGHPQVLYFDSELLEILLSEGNDDQLMFVPPDQRLIYEIYDCRIGLGGDVNTRILSTADLARQRLRRQALGPLSELAMRRTAEGTYRWVGTQFPTQALAQEAGMSLVEYEAFFYRACFVDQPDPAAAWRALGKRQEQLVNYLRGKNRVRVVGPNVELTLSIAGRTWVNSHGRRNMPCGEIFTGPVETSVDGWIRFTYPALYASREVDGIELRFVDGKVVNATADKGQAFLDSVLDTDAGARYLGEFAIGTNYGITRFTRSILFDEKIGGTIHVAVGAGYPQTGSENRSAVHWDMICDMREGGQIWVDGELFYDSGQFQIGE
jgi:aminopeptidase